MTRNAIRAAAALLALCGAVTTRAAAEPGPGLTREQLCSAQCSLKSFECAVAGNTPDYCTAFFAGCYTSCRLF